MRVRITPHTIELEIKPFVWRVNPLPFQEEITHLQEHMKSGSILPHVEGVYFKSNIETLCFHTDYAVKQKVVQMAADTGIGQEEFSLRAVQSFVAEKEKTST